MTAAQVTAPGPGPVPRASADVPLTPVQVYAPTRRRRLWWYTYNCPTCGEHQFGKARDQADVPGARRGRCGHRLEVVVTRTLGDAP